MDEQILNGLTGFCNMANVLRKLWSLKKGCGGVVNEGLKYNVRETRVTQDKPSDFEDRSSLLNAAC